MFGAFFRLSQSGVGLLLKSRGNSPGMCVAEGPAPRKAAPYGKEFPGPAVSSAGVEKP